MPGARPGRDRRRSRANSSRWPPRNRAEETAAMRLVALISVLALGSVAPPRADLFTQTTGQVLLAAASPVELRARLLARASHFEATRRDLAGESHFYRGVSFERAGL